MEETSSSRGRTLGFLALGALVALAGVGIYSARRAPPGAAIVTAAPDAPAAGADGGASVTATIADVILSPQARIIAEGLKCVCGCDDVLADCVCEETPGSRDMKQYVQQLVNEGKSAAQVRDAMVARYGAAALP